MSEPQPDPQPRLKDAYPKMRELVLQRMREQFPEDIQSDGRILGEAQLEKILLDRLEKTEAAREEINALADQLYVLPADVLADELAMLIFWGASGCDIVQAKREVQALIEKCQRMIAQEPEVPEGG